MNHQTDLETRKGLPDALRVLLEDYPRDAWEADPAFSELIRFWLDRHLMFRRINAMMIDDAERALDGKLDPSAYGQRLSRLGSTFVNELHGHHMIEDSHYFPRMRTLDPRLERGFEILDRDHHAIDGHLAAFAEAANATLGGLAQPGNVVDRIAPMRPALIDMTSFLDRHLTDEEDLVVPVLLHFAPAGLA